MVAGARHRHVQQADLLGVAPLPLALPRLVPARRGHAARAREAELQPPAAPLADRHAGGTGGAREIGEDDDRELQSLRLVHRQDLDAGTGARVQLAEHRAAVVRLLFPQPAHERGQRVEAGVRQRLGGLQEKAKALDAKRAVATEPEHCEQRGVPGQRLQELRHRQLARRDRQRVERGFRLREARRGLGLARGVEPAHEIVVRQREGRPAQRREAREAMLRLQHGLQQRGQRSDLVARVEALAAGHGRRNAGETQRIDEFLAPRDLPHQHRHVVRAGRPRFARARIPDLPARTVAVDSGGAAHQPRDRIDLHLAAIRDAQRLAVALPRAGRARDRGGEGRCAAHRRPPSPAVPVPARRTPPATRRRPAAPSSRRRPGSRGRAASGGSGSSR